MRVYVEYYYVAYETCITLFSCPIAQTRGETVFCRLVLSIIACVLSEVYVREFFFHGAHGKIRVVSDLISFFWGKN